MAGDFVPEEDLKLQGIQKYFNSHTLRGRFNFVVATYGTILAGVLLYKLLRRGSKDVSKPRQTGSPSAFSTTSTSGTSSKTSDTTDSKKQCCCD